MTVTVLGAVGNYLHANKIEWSGTQDLPDHVGTKKMMMRTRKFFAGAAIAATAAVAVAGATLSGQTREAPTTAEICATAAWPNIPAECLDGVEHGSVRVIGMNQAVIATTTIAGAAGMDERFAVAFQ